MKVLVTGGAGFIGSNLTKKLLQLSGYQIRVIDNLSTGKIENISDILGDIEFNVGNVRDDHFVRKNVSGVEVIFHQAALPSVQRSIQDPVLTNDVNINGTLTLLVAARDQNVKRFAYASSSSIYGDSPSLPKSEIMAVDPKSPYALSKYTGKNTASFSTDYSIWRQSVCDISMFTVQVRTLHRNMLQ